MKQQPWPVRRKLKLVQQAKAYVKRHEGELQDRLKQSRSTRDILTRFNIVLIKVSPAAAINASTRRRVFLSSTEKNFLKMSTFVEMAAHQTRINKFYEFINTLGVTY